MRKWNNLTLTNPVLVKLRESNISVTYEREKKMSVFLLFTKVPSDFSCQPITSNIRKINHKLTIFIWKNKRKSSKYRNDYPVLNVFLKH